MQATLERLRERREERGDEGGFTLIELLIVIVILGILAAIVVFAVQNLSGESANAACQSDFKTIQVAAETYKAEIGSYPTAVTALTGTATNANSGQTDGPWLKSAPTSTHYAISLDPAGSGAITVTPTGGAGATATDAKSACAAVNK